jgi:type I restriction enzyme S subunit
MAKIKIGDFLYRIKRPITLKSNKEYKLVTIKIRHKGITLRGMKKGSEIKSKMYEVKEGDFILSGIDARNGAFGIIPKNLDGAIVTNDFWYFELDEKLIDKKFFLELTSTSWFDEICRLGSDGTTQRIRLQKNKFFNQEIELPSLDKQKEFLEKFLKIKKSNIALLAELQTQQTLLKKLRQAILQEAIEGKLTASWREKNPNIESASVLLEKIKAEKEELIKAKKIRKQKPLPPIQDSEIPFEIPENWVWCKINDICFSISSGSTPSKDNFIENGIPYLKVYNIRNQKIDLEYKKQFIKPKIHNTKLSRSILYPKDVIMNIVGPPLGKVAIIPDNYPEWNCNQAIVHFKLVKSSMYKYLYYFLQELSFLKYIHFKGVAGQDNISVTQSRNIIFPLPPLQEQKEIVKKIESLFKLCDKLEEQIKSSKESSEKLMQSVLREAFEKKMI